ncbi:MAG: inositol monophosphatase [Acidilobaceae archaeon]|nr:inositol monophosphatase [Acidilobaceae archaeon]
MGRSAVERRGRSVEHDPDELRKIAERAALEAARLLRENACSSSFTRGVGGDSIRADVIAEDYIIDLITREGLELRIVSEERGSLGEGELRAIIDPLDGSSNYAACIPIAAVSIAFAVGPRLRDVAAGAVAPVFHGEPFSFARGRGCPLERRQRDHEVVVLYSEDPESFSSLLKVIWSRLSNAKIRNLGSAALEIAYVAAGNLKLFADARGSLRNVDVAASLGLLRECGGEAYGREGAIVDGSTDRVEVVGDVIASLDKEFALAASLSLPRVRRS